MTPVLGLILVGAGSSSRMGGIDKVWADLGGRPLLWRSLHVLSPIADRTALVVRNEHVATAEDLSRNMQSVTVVAGGGLRQESVANGLHALGDVDLVAIHDAARPLVRPRLLLEGARIAAMHGAAVPVVAMADTIKRIDGSGVVRETLDRALLRAAQTPQVFQFDWLVSAHEQVLGQSSRDSRHASPYTDEASMLEAIGKPVQACGGDPMNFKVTTALDLEFARFLLRIKEGTECA